MKRFDGPYCDIPPVLAERAKNKEEIADWKDFLSASALFRGACADFTGAVVAGALFHDHCACGNIALNHGSFQQV
jgi:hypothetical protein